ncbi:MAG: aminopeptidase P N-terminal domain-containing protein [Sphingomicrobium sp.]
MFDRRLFLGSAAGLALSTAAGAQMADPRAYGSPGATRPFGPEVYRERRQRLMQQMKTGVAVIYGAKSIDGSSTVAGVGRQDSDFAYLTGIMDEAGAALVLAPGERTFKEYLFLATRDPDMERFEGEQLNIGEEARARTGFQKVYRSNWLGTFVTNFAARAGELQYVGSLVPPERPVPPALDLYGRVAARVPGTRITNRHGLIEAMRVVKEPREIAAMRKAIEATHRGMLAAMRAARPGMREFELRNIIENEFRAAGARGLAFPSIVGTGRNSAVLHYTGSDTEIRAGDMILCDIGAEVDFYAADITRTFPVDGRFNPEQRQVYETVLAAQDAAAARLRPGVLYEDLQLAANDVMRRAGHMDNFWHGLGHFVGLDVHDAGNLSAPLPAGAVVTIEPGIYQPQRGFGVRIEDDYLVTASGYERMSRAVPRTVAEVEAVLAAR